MKKVFSILIIMLISLVSCKKDKDFSGVDVELKNEQITQGEAEISYYTDYTYPSKLKSVTMLLSKNPTMDNARTVVCDVGYSMIRATVTELSYCTVYYYMLRYDTGYGVLESDKKSFLMGNYGDGLPMVSTGSVTDITRTSATCAGNVLHDGGFYVTTRGVCWSTSQNPTINNAHNASGSGTGSYTVYMPALTANTTYYVRAYAKNEKGISYGNEVSFKTQR